MCCASPRCRLTDIPIHEGEVFLLPPEVPHSPQRPAGSVGIVVGTAPQSYRTGWLFVVLRQLRQSLVPGARAGRQYRDRAAGDLLALLFQHRAPHLQRLRYGDGGAGMMRQGRNLKHPELNAAAALAQDARDPLAALAAEFHHPYDADGRKMVYLSGHSLGLQAKSTADYVEQELADWRRLGVLGHTHAKRPWIGYTRP